MKLFVVLIVFSGMRCSVEEKDRSQSDYASRCQTIKADLDDEKIELGVASKSGDGSCVFPFIKACLSGKVLTGQELYIDGYPVRGAFELSGMLVQIPFDHGLLSTLDI
jgi:hypothetical protein